MGRGVVLTGRFRVTLQGLDALGKNSRCWHHCEESRTRCKLLINYNKSAIGKDLYAFLSRVKGLDNPGEVIHVPDIWSRGRSSRGGAVVLDFRRCFKSYRLWIAFLEVSFISVHSRRQGVPAAFTLKRKSISSLIEWRMERGFPLNCPVGEKKSIMRINIVAEDLNDQLVVGISKCEIVRTCNKCNICNKLFFFLYQKINMWGAKDKQPFRVI